jgi:putative Mg2+ transporter-C (MgtC) family protein
MGIEIILKMLLAAVLGGIIGLEREIAHKEAGLRANVLIAMAAALLTALALEWTGGPGDRSPGNGGLSPLVGHIISALGLIGAGIVIRERFTAQGLTTAAAVWCAGAVGVAAGAGSYLIAFAAALFIVIALVLLKYVSAILDRQVGIFSYIITTEDRASVIVEIKRLVLEMGIKYINANMKKNEDGYEVEMALHTSQTKNKNFIDRLMQIPDVKEVSSDNL